jgi:hypothetical protein
MPSLMQILLISPAVVAVVYGQGNIISAQGTKGSAVGLGLQVNLGQTDANIINVNEINNNIVNECGRTLLRGNIDIGTETEGQLVNKTVTSVTKGGPLTVTIKQGDANGAGPYTCDIDPTGNSQGATGQTALKVTETDSASGDITLSMTMPTDLACSGCK